VKRKPLTNAHKFALTSGYLLAVPTLFLVKSALKEPSKSWPILVAHLAGMSLITSGWLLSGRLPGWLPNASWLLIFSGFCVRALNKQK
jgi:hypothetical protein